MKLNDSNLFRQQALINGEWLDANDGEVIDVTNPANGDKLGSVPKMGADETRAAIDAANRALPAWRALTAKERANILRNWFNLMMEHQDDLARLMTLEQGKPLAEAKGEISYAASFIEWFAEEGKRIYGDTIPGHQADKRLIVINKAGHFQDFEFIQFFPFSKISPKRFPKTRPRILQHFFPEMVT
ncbi:aldehyde dehydrogenase family protein, partial [Escherichia coli]|uniref:aldehyde dehydrogenase family protein n=1 Tax=Escherichia coli TaxID=562 RepID=UPI001CD18363